MSEDNQEEKMLPVTKSSYNREASGEHHKKQSTSDKPGGTNRSDTRIFSPLAVPRLYVTIGHYWYLFKRLTAALTRRFYRFEHIVSYSSGKVVAKSETHAVSKFPMRIP